MNGEELKRALLLTPCISKEALRNWFRLFLKVHVFSDISSRFASSSPLDAAWEVYDFCIRPQTQTPKKFLFASARNTQKTLVLAAVETAIMIHTRRSVLHFAASKDQVENAYAYMVEFFRRPYIKDLLDGNPTQTETRMIIPSYDNEDWLHGISPKEIETRNPDAVKRVEVQVLPITPLTVQGKHKSVLSADETHTLAGQKLMAYRDLQKIPTSSWDGKPYVWFNISSRKGPYTIVEKEITDSHKSGLNVKRWTVLEGIEQCPAARSGTDWEHSRYVDVAKAKIYTEDEYKNLDQKEKDSEMMQKTTFARGCLKCPLRSVCLGDLSKPKRPNKYHQSIDAAVVEFIGADLNWYLAQCMSLQPAKEGMVFPTYDPRSHYVDADRMYEIFTGKKPDRPQTSATLASLFRQKGLKPGLGLDHGYTHPATFKLSYTDGERVFTVLAFGKTGLEPDDLSFELSKIEKVYGRFPIYPDTSRPDLNNFLANKGYDIRDQFDKDVEWGIEAMRRALSQKSGAPKWYILAPDCEPLHKGMQRYHYQMKQDGTYSDEVVKEEDDEVDAARYYFENTFQPGGGLKVAKDVKDKVPEGRSTPESLVATQLYNLTGDPAALGGSATRGSTGGFSWDFGDENDDS